VKESGCIFRFNYAEVYWNSRLQEEHGRLVALLESKAVVCDVFAGVGPFAIPAAKKGCTVYANDLNPKSYEYMKENAKKNKVMDKVFCYNLDGRDFIRYILQQNISFDHFIMNLPASAIEFLDALKGSFPPSITKMPTIHCYGFSKDPKPEQDVVNQVETILGTKLQIYKTHDVRDVSPKKKE